MKVSVIGTGAVGLGIGSCLLASGVGVRFVVRSREHREALESEGISRTGLFGDVRFGPESFRVADELEADDSEGDDHWLVCAKSTASAELAQQVAGLLRKRGKMPPVVLFQNGWGNAEVFAESIPRQQVFNARVITGFERRGTSQVEVTVHADAIHIGSLFGASLSPILPLAEAIDRGGIPCQPSNEIEKDLWAKVLYNVLLNPLGALLRVPYGVLGERRETRAIMQCLAEEIFELLDVTGHRTHWRDAEEYLETFYGKLLPPTLKHESSMLQDLRAGRRSEIDALCGAITKLARDHEVGAPLNEALTDLIHAAEARRDAAPASPDNS